MSNVPHAPVVGGMTLIVACFLVSAAMRVADSGPALAQELGTLTTFKPAAGTVPEGVQQSTEADTLMRALRDRESQLDAQSQQLADREQALKVAEHKLAEQLAAFNVAQRNLEQTLAQADKAAERDIDRMKTVYEAMKPAEAAQIFQRMETSFASGLLARMRPEVAANVLAAMEPDAAYAITLTIASRNAAVPKQ